MANLPAVPTGRLPSIDLHDARARCRGHQYFDQLQGPQGFRTDRNVESLGFQKSNRLRATSGFTRALAPRCFQPQLRGYIFHLCYSLDECTCAIFHPELRESMTELKSI